MARKRLNQRRLTAWLTLRTSTCWRSTRARPARARSSSITRARRRDGQREFQQIYPQPGWVEHDPEDIWAIAARDVRRRCCMTSGLTAADIAAIGITNQRETTVVWDRATGAPDRTTPSSGRTAAPPPICDELKAAGWERTDPREDRPGDRRLLLRHQGQLAARQRPRRARARRARRTALRHRRYAA